MHRKASGAWATTRPQRFLSSMRRPLWEHCKQRFAQVTNPPIDPLREAHVMSLDVHLDDTLLLPSPLLDFGQWQEVQKKLQPVAHIDFSFEVADGSRERSDYLGVLKNSQISKAPALGFSCLSDCAVNAQRTALPALLALAAFGNRWSAPGCWNIPLIIETGQVVDTHHTALLIAAGASAVFPYAAMEQAANERADGVAAYRSAIENGLRKVIARMGISKIASYRNSQLSKSSASTRICGIAFSKTLEELSAVKTSTDSSKIALHATRPHSGRKTPRCEISGCTAFATKVSGTRARRNWFGECIVSSSCRQRKTTMRLPNSAKKESQLPFAIC